ncbi:hypothetical protein FQN57_001818 [Myotisia sp. PD_48]|nr:hypothetical protein FQN57_001818 [Myotisia sp. PD_48]
MAKSKRWSFLSLISLFTAAASADFDCANIRVDGVSWDLHTLGGPRSVFELTDHPVINTTYTLDICKPLADKKCKAGTFVCASRVATDTEGKERVIELFEIAGNFITDNGKVLDPRYTRLKAEDPTKEGLRVELHGGKTKYKGKEQAQMAVFDFICDRERTGLEGEGNGTDEKKDDKPDQKKESDNKDTDEKTESDDKSRSLQFKSYNPDQGVLKVEWHTKYACENVNSGEGGNSSGRWGAFTWIIIILFLCVSAYLIFGSWLNYNRYGARGWDLLPHGDTLRDVPYILRDWARRVLSTLQGPGTRGGYSAV